MWHLTRIGAGEPVHPPFKEWKLNAVHLVAYQAWNIRLTGKGSDQTVRIRMLV